MWYTSFLCPVLIAFGISVILCPIFIPFLKRMNCGQCVREDGPKEHRKKNGTPTMGGIVILLSVVITSLLYMIAYPKLVPVLFVTLGFGIIGFLDDYIKIVMKRSKGLSVLQKIILQLIVTAIFAVYYMTGLGGTTKVLVPFSGGGYLELGIFFLPFLFLTMLGTVNGANFTDGLDGLASGVTLMIATFLSVVAVGTKHEIAPITCAVVGALLGFLIYNVYPARVFMGDTGSLALGGFVASSAFLLQIPLFIVIIGIVYLIEVISVILQVLVYRLCHKKRLFKMAPIHHHFELKGWKETRIVAIFTIVTAVFCMIALLGI